MNLFIFYFFLFYSFTDSIPAGAQQLINSYPGIVVGYKNNSIFFNDGTSLVYDDQKEKSENELIISPDIEDQFTYEYVIGKLNSNPLNDPGRIRNEDFFKKVYGSSKEEVEKNLVEVVWCPKLVRQKILVTRINQVNKKIELVSKELDNHPEFKKYLLNIGGAFNWRFIAGTNRLSMHSFGMTIDLNTNYADYWQWDCKCDDENSSLKYKNEIPQGIIDIFEKHGFIWGGKWQHYDTMHFEYRPELMN